MTEMELMAFKDMTVMATCSSMTIGGRGLAPDHITEEAMNTIIGVASYILSYDEIVEVIEKSKAHMETLGISVDYELAKDKFEK